jgi:hypothetical protein
MVPTPRAVVDGTVYPELTLKNMAFFMSNRIMGSMRNVKNDK